MFYVSDATSEALATATRVYLVHERGVGHEDAQVDVNGRHHAALQLKLPELHRVHIVELQDQTVYAALFHLLVCRRFDAN